MNRVLGFFTCCILLGSVAAAPKSADITGEFRKVSGQWKIARTAINGENPGGGCVCAEYVGDVASNYLLIFQFERIAGEDTIGVILPVGKTGCVLEIGGWHGKTHGISFVDGHTAVSKSNPTSVKPGTIKNGRPYKIAVAVKTDSENADIKVYMNKKELLKFNGKLSQLRPNPAFRIGKGRLGLSVGAHTTVHFTKVRLRTKGIKPMIADRPELDPLKPRTSLEKHKEKILALGGGGDVPKERVVAADAKANIDLSKVDSITINGKTTIDLTRATFSSMTGTSSAHDLGGTKVLHLKGEHALAFLPGILMGDGVIECDISSGTFSGLVFRGKNMKTYECVYVRPFNAGTTKYKETVQYVSQGVAGGDWKSLRAKFPGLYEASANLKPNEWFHLKILLKGRTMAVYVNNDAKPALVVKKLLGGRSVGKIGVLGWDTYFCNFSITPAK